MKKKNILIVASTLHTGGAENVIENLATKIDRNKFNVKVCYLKENGVVGERISKNGIEVVGINRKSGIRKYFSFIGLLNLVKSRNIELLHSHTTHTLIDTALCKIFYPRVKLVHTFHFGNYPHIPKKYLLLERLFSRIPDMLVPVGYNQSQQLKEIYPFKENKIRVIWNGVGFKYEPDAAVRDKYHSEHAVLLGTICMISEQKGLDILLEVVNELKRRSLSFSLLIVGDGPLANQTKALAEEMNLSDCVHFLGIYPNASSRVLPIFDIFVQSSLWEAMSIAIIEAMSQSKAIVATDVGDNKKVVGEGGFIVPAKDVEAMADSIENLINNNETRLAQGKIGYKRYQKYCTLDVMTSNYESLFLELLN